MSYGRELQARLLELDVWEEVRCAALYAPWQDEPPLDALVERLTDVSLAWPRIEADRIVLRRSPMSALVPGYRGIREPPADSEPVPPDEIDVFVVPGLLFDRRGFRLGRGRGHYDRLLSGARSDSLRIGVVFAERLVDELPVDEWDVRMDFVVTQTEQITGVFRHKGMFRGKGRNER